MSRRSKASKDDASLLGQVAELGRAGATGVLTVAAAGRSLSRVYFLAGEIVACNAEDDDAWLRRQLAAEGLLTDALLEGLAPELARGQDLSDLLVRRRHLSGAEMMRSRATLFRDSFLWASSGDRPALDFEAQEMVFPQNMQFGVDRDGLSRDAMSWLAEVHDALTVVGTDAVHVATGERPHALTTTAWERLSRPSAGMALLEATSVSTREEALRVLAGLLATGSLHAPSGSTPTEASPLAEHAPPEATPLTESAVGIAPAEVAAALAEIDAMESESASIFIADAEADEESIELDLERPEIDDYDRAMRGDFIKSYRVLDKVDLSGVSVLGAGGGPSMEGVPAIELGEDDDVGANDEDDEDLDGMLDALGDDLGVRVPDTSSQLNRLGDLDGEPAAPELDDFDIFEDAVEEIAELHVFEDLSMSDVGLTEEVVDQEPEDVGALATADNIDVSQDGGGQFGREELRSFHERIDIFNNIFRIIFSTFSEHIGGENARQRFNALLSSNQRQYPELFADILVGADGTVQAAPLVNNLSSCTAGDYGSLLHQGLYELIFSHLYDAKDMLPGDVETGMMEKILVFERQLHAN